MICTGASKLHPGRVLQVGAHGLLVGISLVDESVTRGGRRFLFTDRVCAGTGRSSELVLLGEAFHEVAARLEDLGCGLLRGGVLGALTLTLGLLLLGNLLRGLTLYFFT